MAAPELTNWECKRMHACLRVACLLLMSPCGILAATCLLTDAICLLNNMLALSHVTNVVCLSVRLLHASECLLVTFVPQIDKFLHCC